MPLILALLAAACASTGNGESTRAADPSDAVTEAGSGSSKIIYSPSPKSEGGDLEKGDSEEQKLPKNQKPPMESKVTIDLAAGTVGEAVRAIGESHGGNLVLMAGAESRTVPALEFKRADLSEVATGLAAAAELAAQETADYFFLFPPGYEPLVDVSLSGAITPKYGRERTDVTFGYGLRLYTVFAWMSYALDRNIVADNSVADARCGELALQQVPLETAIEAILKSARANSFRVDSTEEYVFIYNPNNTSPREALLNANPLDREQEQLLNRTVSLILPDAPSPGRPLEMQQHSSDLGEVLASLSRQLGVTVVAEKSLENLPVNPVVLNGVRLGTALDLVVRQWLVPNYGYQVTHDRIVIRVRQPDRATSE